ncbi:MAG: zinc-dependent alcohol dehydrogenase family protein [bacterium]|nr:zinc-dependent alcohol dehydrogenase family protein [bacterium]
MKAAVFYGVRNLKLQSIKVRELLPGEIMVRVRACGICGTDLHIYHGDKGSAAVVPPVILGHEFAGDVVQVAEDVTLCKPGDRVSIDPNIHCGKCRHCRIGKINLCSNLQAIGVTQDGGFAEMAIVPEAQAYPIPDKLSYEQGAMGEPVACCVHGIDQAGIRCGDSVLIIGAGPIGLIMLQLAKLMGAAQLIVSEPQTRQRKLAQFYGADAIINPEQQQTVAAVKEYCVDGVDVAIECVGIRNTMLEAVQSCRRGGSVIMFGLAAPDCEIPIKPYDIFEKELTIRSSFINPFTQHRALNLLGSGKVQVMDLISEIQPLDQIVDIFENWDQRPGGKIIIRP